MKEKVRFLGLDVHAETIAVAVAEPDGEVRSLGTIANRAESIRKMIKKLGPAEKLRACYEAGPTGYVVYWQLAELGVQCEVVAPTLVPIKAGDRVKTDRRDAEKPCRLRPVFYSACAADVVPSTQSLSSLRRCSPVACVIRTRYTGDDDSSRQLLRRFVVNARCRFS
jgi:transposase